MAWHPGPRPGSLWSRVLLSLAGAPPPPHTLGSRHSLLPHTTDTGTTHPSGQGFTSRGTKDTSHGNTDGRGWAGRRGSRRPPVGPRLLTPSSENTGCVLSPHSALSPTRTEVKSQEEPGPSFQGRPGHAAWALWAVSELFIDMNCPTGDYSQPDFRNPMGRPPKHTQVKYNK